MLGGTRTHHVSDFQPRIEGRLSVSLDDTPTPNGLRSVFQIQKPFILRYPISRYMEVESHNLYGEMDREEALRRFPEADDIENEELREQVIQTIRQFPDYFWTAPAASKHHAPEHRQRHGLWLHTKRVCTVMERLAQSMVKQGHLSWEEVDYARAACILHDMYKYGIPPTSVDSTVKDHDVTAADWLRDHTKIPDEVCGAVEAHNGPWYVGHPPSSHLEQIVHIADMVGSDENIRVAVKEPHPVLREQFARVSYR